MTHFVDHLSDRVVYRLRTDGVIEVAYIRDCRRRFPPRP